MVFGGRHILTRMKCKQGLLSWVRQVIAVDHGSGAPVAVRAQRRGTSISWHPISLPYTDGFSKEMIVAGLRAGSGMTAWLQTPLIHSRKARQVLPSILDTKLPFPLEDCLYTCGDTYVANQPNVPVSGEGTAALAVVVRRSDLEEIEDTLSAYGLTPHLFDHEGLALWSSIVVHDLDALQVMVWCRSDSLLMVLGVGAMYWSSHLIDGYDVEKLMRLIRLQRQTVADGAYKDARLHWWIGGEENNTASFCSQLEGVSTKEIERLPDGEYYLARVLGERALLGGNWRIPGIPGIKAGRAYSTFLRRRYMQNSVFCLVGATALFIASIGRNIHINREIRAQDQYAQQVVNEIAGYPVTARGQHAVRIAQEELLERRTALQVFANAKDLSVLLGSLAALHTEKNGYIEAVDLDPENVHMMIWLPAGTSTDALQQTLLEYGYIMEVAEAVQEQSDMVQFRLRGERR